MGFTHCKIRTINFCRYGSYFDGRKIDIPRQQNEKDTLVLLILGNETLLKDDKIVQGGNFHYVNPRYMDDSQVDKLIDNLVSFMTLSVNTCQ